MKERTFQIGRLEAFKSPFTGKFIDRTRCGICDERLPLPGEYPLMVVDERPDAKLHDCTGDPGSTTADGTPKVVQRGSTILKAVCWHHVQ